MIVKVQPKHKPEHKPVNKAKKEYHVELFMYYSKSFKRKNNKLSKFYKQKDPLTVSQIVLVENQEDYISIASDNTRDDFICVDSYYMGSIDSIESASALFF